MSDEELNQLSERMDQTAAELREDLASVKADVDALMVAGIERLEPAPEPVEPPRRSRVWKR
jgi:hypothetical protein